MFKRFWTIFSLRSPDLLKIFVFQLDHGLADIVVSAKYILTFHEKFPGYLIYPCPLVEYILKYFGRWNGNIEKVCLNNKANETKDQHRFS